MLETMVDTATRATDGSVARLSEQAPTEQLKASLRKLLDQMFGLALEKVEGLARNLDDVAVRGGLPVHALLGGVMAKLENRNPIWGAIRGAVAAMSPGAKVALVAVLALAVLLLPLTVVLLLLALIITAAVVAAVRSGSR